MANLSKTLRINFYQNRSSIVEVMIKKFWCVFYASQCSGSLSCVLTAVAAMLGNSDVACAAAAMALMIKQPVNII